MQQGHHFIHSNVSKKVKYLQCLNSFILIFLDDFRPASVDSSKVATLDVSSNNQVTVTVPHLGKNFLNNYHHYFFPSNFSNYSDHTNESLKQ